MLQNFILQLLLGRDDEKGATATEYALLVAFIAFGIVIAVGFFGDALAGFFGELTTTVGNWNGTGAGN